MVASDIIGQSNLMLELAFNERLGPSADRIEKMTALAADLGPVIAQSLFSTDIREYRFLAPGLRAASVIACLPSLETVARFEPHNLDTADRVSRRLHSLGNLLLGTSDLKPATIRERVDWNTYANAIGQLSEIAVLSLLWWGIASGLENETCYVLPKQSVSGVGKYMRNATVLSPGLITRKSGSGKKRTVRVASTIPRAEEKRLSRDDPGMAIVNLARVFGNPRGRPELDRSRLMLWIIKEKRRATLEELHLRTVQSFRQASKRQYNKRKKYRG